MAQMSITRRSKIKRTVVGVTNVYDKNSSSITQATINNQENPGSNSGINTVYALNIESSAGGSFGETIGWDYTAQDIGQYEANIIINTKGNEVTVYVSNEFNTKSLVFRNNNPERVRIPFYNASRATAVYFAITTNGQSLDISCVRSVDIVKIEARYEPLNYGKHVVMCWRYSKQTKFKIAERFLYK